MVLRNELINDSGTKSPDLATAARHYWQERARRFAGEGAGLRAICSYGMPEFYNRYIHLTQRLALAPWLRIQPGTRVLEIGCGVGRWSLLLARRGARVTGIDIAEAMVEEARMRAGRAQLDDRCDFLTADLTSLDLGARYERILCVTVLQHIIEEARFQTAIDRLAAHLLPGGRIIMLEAAPSSEVTRCDSAIFRARTFSQYRTALSQAGLHCEAVTGVDPMPLKTLFLPWYKRLPRPLALAGLATVTALSLPADAVAGRLLANASWHKVFVATSNGLERGQRL